MQLNNLVIIPIPYQGQNGLGCRDLQTSSPFKNYNKTISLRDQIPWKKSQSAFKKFKGKKDKESKSLKISQANIVFLQPNQSEQTFDKNFCLVDNDINLSLLKSQNQQAYQNEEAFDYFDPNIAPFFQYGILYQYIPKERRVRVIQEQQPQNDLFKRSQSLKLKKEASKKQKSKEQFPEKEGTIKSQKKYMSESHIIYQTQYFDDPFIIIKAFEKRGQYPQPAIRNQQIENGQYRKNKLIRKGPKAHSGGSSVYSYSVYSNQNSDNLIKQCNQQKEQKSDDYGSDQLPFIEFDLCKHINSSVRDEQKPQNDRPGNTTIYEVKDDSQILLRTKQFQSSNAMLNQYEFLPDYIQGENDCRVIGKQENINPQLE